MTAPAYGQLIRTGDLAVLEYRRRFDRAPENVWRALTEPDRLAAWFPTTIDGERTAGAALTFRFGQLDRPGAGRYVHINRGRRAGAVSYRDKQNVR